MTKSGEIFQIKVTLRHSQPPIWRRMQVRSDTTLAKLHRTLQCVMGWEDAHLQVFTIQGERYGVPEKTISVPAKPKEERTYRLSELVSGEDTQFGYDYDFGDNWEHVLVVERCSLRTAKCATPSAAPTELVPVPREDVGGIGRYDDFLQAVTDPAHPEHEDFTEWIGDTFDPEEFDVNEVNQKLRGAR